MSRAIFLSISLLITSFLPILKAFILDVNQKIISNQPKNPYYRYDSKWTKFSVQSSLILEDIKSKIVVGSCSLDSDGFIAFVSNCNELIWSIYSEHTGAFRHIEYRDNEIIVESSRGYRYLISLDTPLEIKRLESELGVYNREGRH